MMKPRSGKCEGNFATGATNPWGSFLSGESRAGGTDTITKDQTPGGPDPRWSENNKQAANSRLGGRDG